MKLRRKVIYSEDGKTKKGVVKEHFAKVIKRCSDRVENEDPNMKRSRENTMREHSEKVENVLHHFADNFHCQFLLPKPRARSSLNDDIFDTDSILRYKMIYLF